MNELILATVSVVELSSFTLEMNTKALLQRISIFAASESAPPEKWVNYRIAMKWWTAADLPTVVELLGEL